MNTIDVAQRCFDQIKSAFPEFRWQARTDLPVDLACEFPIQPGLDFEIFLNLQNVDELVIDAAGLWISFFPCTRMEEQEVFVKSVLSIIRGEYRIAKHRLGPFDLGATLEASTPGGWKVVGGSGLPSLIPVRWQTHEYIQNNRS